MTTARSNQKLLRVNGALALCRLFGDVALLQLLQLPLDLLQLPAQARLDLLELRQFGFHFAALWTNRAGLRFGQAVQLLLHRLLVGL